MATKAEIIAAIRRTASENGGAPLGWKRFLTSTGIKESEWLGVYWARWSDAIQEAGLEPNHRSTAVADDVRLSEYARICAELGRLPTVEETKLHVKDGTRNMPSLGVSTRRYGGRRNMIVKLREYCDHRPEYSAVVALCDVYLAQVRTPIEVVNTESVSIGYVYLFRLGNSTKFKLGCSKNELRRLGEISVELPEEAVSIHSIKTDDMYGVEAYWHNRFKNKRLNGEWFNLNSSDVAAFKRWKKIF